MKNSMESFTLLLFGATGDLAKNKIWRAVFDLYTKKHLPENFNVVGIGRSKHTEESFRAYVADILQEEADSFLKRISYIQADIGSDEGVTELKKKLLALESEKQLSRNLIMHLAILPDLYAEVVARLGRCGLNHCDGWVRLLIEKPFGNNGKTAKELDTILHEYYSEETIFRIDHYLAKETVQNILAFRFGNGLFEPIWNRDFIDSIQVSMLEDIGVDGRGKFYDRVGTLRDVVQNHLLQVIATTLMDAPESFVADAVRSSRQKLLGAIKHLKSSEDVYRYTVRGQYEGFHEVADVKPDSPTETFTALRLEIESERWQGVPIYIRAGKRLSTRASEVSIIFKTPAAPLFTHYDGRLQPNVLTLRLSPNESIGFQLFVKKPGAEMLLDTLPLQACYKDLIDPLMEPYEKVLLDAYWGDQTLFASAKEVEAQWAVADPILAAWEKDTTMPVEYQPGTDGPADSDALLERDGRTWIDPNLSACKL